MNTDTVFMSAEEVQSFLKSRKRARLGNRFTWRKMMSKENQPEPEDEAPTPLPAPDPRDSVEFGENTEREITIIMDFTDFYDEIERSERDEEK